jgi:CubicO group peptidase (beta-lactamase class C family)
VPDQPGCAVGVLRDGRFLHAKGYGAANLDYGLAITPDSVFRSGSLAKQFTAHAVALLALRKQLDLDADIHEYLPELADYGMTVTPRQMIHHISGMGDYGFDPQRFLLTPGKPFRFGNQDYWTPREFFEAAAVQPLVAPPGQTYLYSNLAYFFLGQLVERVSGMTLREFTRREFFSPLSMNDTFFNDNINDVVARRATGYLMTDNDRFEMYETNNGWVGNGGLYTSLNDLAKWDRAFIAGNVPGGNEAVKILTTPHPVTLGTMKSSILEEGAGYGYGLQLGTYNGHEVQAHGGAWVGFRALYARFPQTRLSVIILCNRRDGRSLASIHRLLDHSLAWANR